MVSALRHGTWMDEKSFEETCITQEKKKQEPISLSTVHVTVR